MSETVLTLIILLSLTIIGLIMVYKEENLNLRKSKLNKKNTNKKG